ncbi:hypothetical protein T484DRAFT_1988881 [Baffinella frigidus]|nr:hypothetical protein T484DRAFT_1988881 [Cryptophyta sp. CCMP2293]
MLPRGKLAIRFRGEEPSSLPRVLQAGRALQTTSVWSRSTWPAPAIARTQDLARRLPPTVSPSACRTRA